MSQIEDRRLPALQMTTGAAMLLWAAFVLPGCRSEPLPEPLFGISVKPPADGDERLTPMGFIISNGSRELRDVIVLCVVNQIATSTMSLSDNSERVGQFDLLAPQATQTVRCDPQVYLDPDHLRLQSATIAIDLEFLVDEAADRQYVELTYRATRHPSGRLTWSLATVTDGAVKGRT